jgi:hypothetical protein
MTRLMQHLKEISPLRRTFGAVRVTPARHIRLQGFTIFYDRILHRYQAMQCTPIDYFHGDQGIKEAIPCFLRGIPHILDHDHGHKHP